MKTQVSECIEKQRERLQTVGGRWLPRVAVHLDMLITVDSKNKAPNHAHILISRTYDYVALHDKGDSAKAIKLRILR